jgi:hypothetical protein
LRFEPAVVQMLHRSSLPSPNQTKGRTRFSAFARLT